MERDKIDILGLAEIRCKEEKIMKTKKQNIFYHTRSEGVRGVGFLVSSGIARNIEAFTEISDRIATIEIQLGEEILLIVQVHAPTLGSDTEEIDMFYKEVNKIINRKVNRKVNLIIIGDLNSQIGKREPGEEKIVGPYHLSLIHISEPTRPY